MAGRTRPDDDARATESVLRGRQPRTRLARDVLRVQRWHRQTDFHAASPWLSLPSCAPGITLSEFAGRPRSRLCASANAAADFPIVQGM